MEIERAAAIAVDRHLGGNATHGRCVIKAIRFIKENTNIWWSGCAIKALKYELRKRRETNKSEKS